MPNDNSTQQLTQDFARATQDMDQSNVVLRHGLNYPINRYDLWEFIIRHWDAILESDIATYAGFDILCASSVFVSWMEGKGSKNTGVIENDFLSYTEIQNTANRLSTHMYDVVTDTISRDLFVKLFYTQKHLIQSTLTQALLYERQRRWK